RLALAPPLVDGPRPLKDAAQCEAVQLHVAIVAFLDAESSGGLAVAVRRQGIELARTAVRAVAVDEFRRLDFPGRHGRSPFRSWFYLPRYDTTMRGAGDTHFSSRPRV